MMVETLKVRIATPKIYEPAPSYAWNETAPINELSSPAFIIESP